MKTNLMLLWLCLLLWYQYAELKETLPINDTVALRPILEDSIPRNINPHTRHSDNSSYRTSGPDLNDQTHNGNETYSTDYRHTTSLSELVSRTDESELDNITLTSELIGTTNDTEYNKHLTTYTFTKESEVNSENTPVNGLEEEYNYEYEEEEEGEEGDEDEEYDGDNYANCNRTCIIFYSIWSVIGFVGIVANICLCMVFVLRKEMRTSANLMIINLAVSDIFSIIFNIILHMVYRSSNTWQAGEIVCKLYFWARFSLIGSSVYSVVVISLQRFFALTISFKTNVFECLLIGKYKPFLIVLLVWILSGALALRYSLHATVDDYCFTYLVSDQSFSVQNDMVDLIVYCIIPLIIIGLSTAVTSIRLKKTAKNMPGELCVNNNARRDRVVSSNVLLALFIVFALSYIPFFSYYVYISWNELDLGEYIDNAMYGLLFINSCFNPVALFIMSRKYRRMLINDIICRKNCAFRVRDTSENSTITVETRL